MRQGIIALLGLVLISNFPVVATAEDSKPSPIYSGAGLPTPPKEREPWPKPTTQLPQSLIKDVALLFDQGVADPRGGEYRQVEVVTGNCWSGDGGIAKTHGWVLPDSPTERQRFVVCWNGLVYPAVSVGDPANLAADVASLADHPGPNRIGATPENVAVSFDSALPLKACLLLRLGEVELAERLWPVVKERATRDPNGRTQPDDAYLGLAREWCWYAFDRAVCAHMWGNDVVSRDTAKLLTDALPKVEASGKDLGFTRPIQMDPNDSNHEIPDARYISFVGQLPALLADEQRRINDGAVQRVLEDPRKFPDKVKRIAALIRDLEVVAARQWSQPGGVDIIWDPIHKALTNEGDDAVEPLLNCLETDERLTRCVSFDREFFEGRNLIPVKSVAYLVLTQILQTETFGPASDSRNRGGPVDGRAIAAEIWAFLAKSGRKPVAERWFNTLADDGAGPARWVEAAGHIVQPVDVERRGRWIPDPQRKPGEVPAMKGKALRAHRDPDVSTLMAKRVPVVAAEKQGWLFAQTRAADLALCLHRWDPAAAVPVLREQMRRCMNASDVDRAQIKPEPNWSQSTQTTEQMARDVGRLTSALAQSGDAEGVRLYRKWAVTQTPAMPGTNVGEFLRPIVRFPDDPELAATAEDLFNGSNTGWQCLPTAVQFRDWGPAPVTAGPIYGVPAFRKHVVRNLEDLTEIGTVQAKERSLQVNIRSGGGRNYGGTNGADPLLPKPEGPPVQIRVCDWYAWKVAKLDGAPPFELYWPLAKRDEQRPKLAAFLERWGNAFRYSALQESVGVTTHDSGNAHLTLPRLERPATEADVAAARAIFSLGGGPVRTVELPAWPARAKWITLKDYPVRRQGQTDAKTGVTKYHDDFLNVGLIWQAEEVEVNGKWERYYGFVGPHVIEKVPADQIEFLKED